MAAAMAPAPVPAPEHQARCESLLRSSLTQDLVATVSQLLDSRDVPSVLWGNFLLTVYGVPSLTNDAAFAVPDEKLSVACAALSIAGLNLCRDPGCIIITVNAHPAPASHFHLEQHDLHISLYCQSEVLPNMPDISDETGDIISAADKSLPGPRIGYGNGALSVEYKSVRIPSAAYFTEACLVNLVRQARKDNPRCPHDLHYLNWASYMIEYVYPGGYLDLDSLQEIFREFLVEVFIKQGAEVFIAAKKKLISSDAI